MLWILRNSTKFWLAVLIFLQAACVTQGTIKSGLDPKMMGLEANAQKDFFVIRSDLHSMNGDWLQAQMDLERALEISSSDSLKLRHALILAQRGQLDKSEAELKTLIESKEMAKNVEANLAYGEVLALLNNAQGSLDAYKRVLELDPKNYKAIIFVGAIYSQVKEFDLAKVYFRRLKTIDEYKHLSGYYLGRLEQQEQSYQKSETYFQECLKLRPDFTDCIFSLVDSLMVQKKVAKAIEHLNTFVENNPDSDRAYAKLYDLFLEIGDQDSAYNQLVQLERFEPQNRFIKMQMALHLVEKNEFDLAITKLNEVALLSPAFGKTYFLLSTIYERQGDEKKAKYYYSKIEKNQPIYIEASIQRAKDIENKLGLKPALSFLKSVDNSNADSRLDLYIAIIQNKLGMNGESIKTLRAVALKNPNDVQVLYYLGHLEGEDGQMGRAILNMKRVIQIEPKHSDALNYLAYYYAENNILLEEAEKMAKLALTIKPDDGHYQDTLGWIYFHKGQYELAQRHLEKAHNLHPDEPIIAEHLAAVYSVKGLKDKAKQLYTNLMERGLGDREKLQRQINSISSQK